MSITGRFNRRTFARCIELNTSCVRIQPRRRLPAPTPRCGLCHDGLLHDFVLVPVGVTIREAGSTDLLGSGPTRPAIFGIEPVPMALSSRTAPFHPAACPTKC